MNPITQTRNLMKMNDRELEMGVAGTKNSWHQEYKDSAWVFIGGLPYELTEGDVICVFSQYGEVVHINLIRDHTTGKSRGFGFLCYEDQRSTILAVDNLNGFKVLGKLLRVDHIHQYKLPKDLEKLDQDKQRLLMEGVAPRALTESESDSSEEDVVLPVKEEKKKKRKKEKKEKKEKKKHKKAKKKDSTSDEEHVVNGDTKRGRRERSAESKKVAPDREPRELDHSRAKDNKQERGGREGQSQRYEERPKEGRHDDRLSDERRDIADERRGGRYVRESERDGRRDDRSGDGRDRSRDRRDRSRERQDRSRDKRPQSPLSDKRKRRRSRSRDHKRRSSS